MNHQDSLEVARAIRAMTGGDSSEETVHALVPVVEQMLSSHKLSCERARAQLKTRTDVLRIVLCKRI